jgi:hypothetical protein
MVRQGFIVLFKLLTLPIELLGYACHFVFLVTLTNEEIAVICFPFLVYAFVYYGTLSNNWCVLTDCLPVVTGIKYE